MPLLANRAVGDRRETLRQLGIASDDRRPRVLVAMRGGIAPKALRRAVAESPEVLFVVTQRVAGEALANVRVVEANRVEFTELLAACDVVVSKLGYGIVSDCLANGVALLFPPRVGFREDEVTRVEAARYLRMREVSREAFEAGDWREDLLALLGQPVAPERIAIDGDRVIACLLLERL